MKSSLNIVAVIVALIIGFGAGFTLRPVLLPTPVTQTAATAPLGGLAQGAEPRSTQYFSAHIDEARRVVAGCQDGSVRGAECTNAGEAVTEADARERFRKFTGN